MTTPEQRAREIFGQRASFYSSSQAHTDPQVLARVVALTQPQKHHAVLDIGTGTGHTAFALASRVANVTGIDLTPEMLSEAEGLRAARGHSNVRFCVADIHRLPHPDGAFPRVTCRRAAHHFSDIEQAVAEMARVLAPGGRLVIDDRSVPDDDFVDACMNDLDRLHDPSHVRQYRPGEWCRLLEGAGLVVDTVSPYTQHRPLSSLTRDVPAANVRRIHERLAGLDDAQRRKLNLTQVDGQHYSNHWYVLVSAAAP